MHSTLANALRTTCEDSRDWKKKLPFVEMALRASPIRGLGISPFELVHGGRKFLLPVDAQMLEKEEEEPAVDLGEYLLEVRKNMEIIESLTNGNIRYNQEVFRRAYDEKAKPHAYYKGEVVFLHDPIKKSEECSKLRRVWRGPYSIIEMVGLQNARLINAQTGKQIDRLVHVDRLKPAYLQDTVEVLNERERRAVGEEERRLTVARETTKEGEVGKELRRQMTVGEQAGDVEVTQVYDPDKGDQGEVVVDIGNSQEYYAAEKIVGQRKVGGKVWYKVRWIEEGAEDSWTLAADVTQGLVDRWLVTHTKEGKLRKSKRT